MTGPRDDGIEEEEEPMRVMAYVPPFYPSTRQDLGKHE
jgi:hypothetical protein